MWISTGSCSACKQYASYKKQQLTGLGSPGPQPRYSGMAAPGASNGPGKGMRRITSFILLLILALGQGILWAAPPKPKIAFVKYNLVNDDNTTSAGSNDPLKAGQANQLVLTMTNTGEGDYDKVTIKPVSRDRYLKARMRESLKAYMTVGAFKAGAVMTITEWPILVTVSPLCPDGNIDTLLLAVDSPGYSQELCQVLVQVANPKRPSSGPEHPAAPDQISQPEKNPAIKSPPEPAIKTAETKPQRPAVPDRISQPEKSPAIKLPPEPAVKSAQTKPLAAPQPEIRPAAPPEPFGQTAPPPAENRPEAAVVNETIKNIVFVKYNLINDDKKMSVVKNDPLKAGQVNQIIVTLMNTGEGDYHRVTVKPISRDHYLNVRMFDISKPHILIETFRNGEVKTLSEWPIVVTVAPTCPDNYIGSVYLAIEAPGYARELRQIMVEVTNAGILQSGPGHYSELYGGLGVTSADVKPVKPEEPSGPTGVNKVKKGRDSYSISQTIKGYEMEVYYCYQQQLRKFPNLKGKVVIKLNVRPWGDCTNIKVVKSTLHDKDVEDCLVRRIKTWKFPTIDDSYDDLEITYPFVFSNNK
jgi:hypothetical protein